MLPSTNVLVGDWDVITSYGEPLNTSVPIPATGTISKYKIWNTRKYPLRGYTLGMLTHTTAFVPGEVVKL